LEKHSNEIKLIAKRYEQEGIHNFRVFGSVATGLDTDKSDVDFLVDTDPKVTLLTIGGLYFELEQLLGSKFDLITAGSLPESLKARINGRLCLPEKELEPRRRQKTAGSASLWSAIVKEGVPHGQVGLQAD
jgi:predicted nucleotidyltransferase